MVEVLSKSTGKEIAPLPTLVEGLDTLLRDGLCLPPSESLVILIKGSPGTGKTTLALQIAKAAVQLPWQIPADHLAPMSTDELPVTYLTFEQRRVDLEEKFEGMGGMRGSINICEGVPVEGSDDPRPFAQVGGTLQKINAITHWLLKPR